LLACLLASQLLHRYTTTGPTGAGSDVFYSTGTLTLTLTLTEP